MPSQHKHSPIRVRLPEVDRAWLLEHHERTGKPVNRIVAEAVAEHRARIEAEGRDGSPAEG